MQENLPCISVITPTLNSEQYVEEAIQSVIGQGYQNFEHIVMDGGSTDKTLSMLARYPHVKVLEGPDGGLYEGLNKGLRACNGDLIGWLNSDDLFSDGVFWKVAEVYKQNKEVDVFVSNGVVFYDRLEKKEFTDCRHFFPLPSGAKEKLCVSHGFINGCFFNKAFIDTVGSFDSNYKISGDKDYLIRVVERKPKCVTIEPDAYLIRSHPGSLTFSSESNTKFNEKMIEEGFLICRKYLSDPDAPLNVKEYCKGILRRRWLMLISNALKRWEVLGALNNLKSCCYEDKWWLFWFVGVSFRRMFAR